MSPTSAIIMLSCIYWGALFGGAITRPVQHPGEPMVGRHDLRRPPMAQQGKAGEALTRRSPRRSWARCSPSS